MKKKGYNTSRSVANSYLVRERDRRRWRELLKVLLAVLPLAFATLSYTWIRMETLRAGYRIERLERKYERVLREERRLRLEASNLTHPGRIEERARRDLGMHPPSLDQVVFLDPEAP